MPEPSLPPSLTQMALTVLISDFLRYALAAGAVWLVVQVLLFVRANMRDVVRASWRGDARRSLKVRPAETAQWLRRHGQRIAVLELEGPLFFGTADALRAHLRTLARDVDIVVVDLRQVREIDVTGARILFETAEDWSAGGKRLILAEWPASDPRRRTLEAVAGTQAGAVMRFEDHADAALERAEDELLERLQQAGAGSQAVALAETALARGLDADELAALQAATTQVHFARGSVIFRRGDPGDALYISLSGDIGLHVPGGQRRLASFAPGVSLGEIAALSHGTRTVDAIAESDVVVLRLPVSTFDEWKAARPQLAAKLLNNIALHLADRLNLLTDDLARWMQRAGAA